MDANTSSNLDTELKHRKKKIYQKRKREIQVKKVKNNARVWTQFSVNAAKNYRMTDRKPQGPSDLAKQVEAWEKRQNDKK